MSTRGYRLCGGCNGNLDKSSYTKNQWAKGVGASRCRICVAELVEIDSNGFGTARRNEKSRCEFNFTKVTARGSFRLVTEGRYVGGRRTGQVAVAKWFKQAYRSISDQFYVTDMNAVEKCLQLLTSFNGEGLISDTIRLNIPEVLTKTNGVQYSVEPYIENFQKFNSNTGWISQDSSKWILIMQALSHYSYHVSSAQYLLCDLQGGLFRDGAILTDPVVMSKSRKFGPTDLGPKGISSFFGRHKCNCYCKSHWQKPADRNLYHTVSEGSSMEYNPNLKTDQYRPKMSAFNEDDEYDTD